MDLDVILIEIVPDDEELGQINPVKSRVCEVVIRILQQNYNKFAAYDT